MTLAEKIFTTKDILALKPCYEDRSAIPENWSGTLIDILESEKISVYQKRWVTLRLMPRILVEVFAIDCAAAAASSHNPTAAYYAANAAFYADADADAAANTVAERERQIDALIYLIETYDPIKDGE